jgi:hypothetical protein
VGARRFLADLPNLDVIVVEDSMTDTLGALPGVLQLSLATVVVAFIIKSFIRRDGPSLSLGDTLVAPAAILSFGAATIHFWVMPAHLDEYLPFGVAFAFLALFQLGWGAAYLRRRPAWLIVVGLVVNAGTVVTWVWSRTAGLPLGPDPFTPEALGLGDLAASLFEVILIAILAMQLEPRTRHRLWRTRITARVAGVARTLTMAAVSLLTLLVVTAPGRPDG